MSGLPVFVIDTNWLLDLWVFDDPRAQPVRADAQDLASLQTELTKPLIDKAVAYARSVQEIATEGQQEVSSLFEKQIAELNKNFAKQADLKEVITFESTASGKDSGKGSGCTPRPPCNPPVVVPEPPVQN